MTILIVALHLAAGTGAGMLYFGAVRRSAYGFTAGGPIAATVGFAVLRFALLAVALTLTSLEGALPLLAAALGILAGRAIVMRRARLAMP